MSLQIPKRHIPAIIKIRELPEASVVELVEALEAATIESKSDDMVSQIAGRVSSILPDDLKAIVDTMYSLYYVRELSDVSPKTFLKDLVEGICEGAKLHLNAGEAKQISNRFRELLSIPVQHAVQSRRIAE